MLIVVDVILLGLLMLVIGGLISIRRHQAEMSEDIYAMQCDVIGVHIGCLKIYLLTLVERYEHLNEIQQRLIEAENYEMLAKIKEEIDELGKSIQKLEKFLKGNVGNSEYEGL